MTTSETGGWHQAVPVGPMGGAAKVIEPIPDPVETDAVDLKLLRLLSEDARISRRQLAMEVGMSAPAVGERLARLERLGVIRGYSVAVDWARLGYSMEVYLNVLIVPGWDSGQVISDLANFPEIESVSSISGAYDLLARMHVRDHQHLTRLLYNGIWQMPSIQRTETQLCFASAPHWKFSTRLLEHMENDSKGAPH